MKKYIIGIKQSDTFSKKTKYYTKYLFKIEDDQVKLMDDFLQLYKSSKIFNIPIHMLYNQIDGLDKTISGQLRMLQLSANANSCTVHIFDSDLDLSFEDFDMMVNSWIQSGESDRLVSSKISL